MRTIQRSSFKWAKLADDVYAANIPGGVLVEDEEVSTMVYVPGLVVMERKRDEDLPADDDDQAEKVHVHEVELFFSQGSTVRQKDGWRLVGEEAKGEGS